jgi:hypothetical protein
MMNQFYGFKPVRLDCQRRPILLYLTTAIFVGTIIACGYISALDSVNEFETTCDNSNNVCFTHGIQVC